MIFNNRYILNKTKLISKFMFKLNNDNKDY